MPAPPPTFLLTGFEPFGGHVDNPSWEIAARLDGWQVRAPADDAARRGIGGAQGPLLAVVRSVRLPCAFDAALAAIDRALERHRPEAVIALGLAASRTEVSVERVAINIDDARIADNAGQQPIDRPVCADGPVAYWSSLPVKAIVAALREAGIAAAVSQSAGTFVCNHVFYGLAHRLAGNACAWSEPGAGRLPVPFSWPPPGRGGFIHVPWPGSADDPATGRMSLAMLVEAIRIAVRVTLTAGNGGLTAPAGAID